jgi:hypothetical protein
MKWMAAFVVLAGCTGLLLAPGCGGGKPVPNLDAAAKVKLEAIKALADEMAKDANGLGARGALENFRIAPLDAQKHPKEAQELVDIYQQRIQGKYQGPVAQELQAHMSQYLPKKAK